MSRFASGDLLNMKHIYTVHNTYSKLKKIDVFFGITIIDNVLTNTKGVFNYMHGIYTLRALILGKQNP